MEKESHGQSPEPGRENKHGKQEVAGPLAGMNHEMVSGQGRIK